MASQNFSFSGATTNTTGTPYAQTTFNLDGSDFSSYFTGNPTPLSNTGRPLLLRSFTLNLSTNSGGDGFLVAQNTPDNDATYDKRSLINVGTLSGSKTAQMNYPFYASGSDDVAWVGFKKNNNGTTVRYQRGSSSGNTIYLVYNGDSSPTVTHSNNALNSSGTVWTSPGAPTSLSVTDTESNSISVSWSAPIDNGGTSVNNYTVFYSSNGSSWSRDSTASTSISLTGLAAETEYEIIVAAHNAVTDYHNAYHGQSAESAGVVVGAGASTSATTNAAYPDVNITNGISNRTVRRGQSVNTGDFISATNKRSDHDATGADWGLSGTYSSYFSIYNNGFSDYLSWDIPTNATIESFTLTLTAYGPSSQDTDTATINIKYPLPDFTDDTLGDGRVGDSYDESISGDSSTSSWIISEDIPGVSYSTDGTKATFEGTPTNFGNYEVTATLRNEGNESGESKTISVTIEDASLSWADQSLSTTTVVQKDTSYSDGVAVNSGPISITYSVTPGESLPTGLNLNSSTGALTVDSVNGITADAGTYSFRIRATNGTNEFIDTQTLSLTVEQAGGFMKVWNGASWVEAPATVWNGSSWVEGTVKVWNGSAWVESFSS